MDVEFTADNIALLIAIAIAAAALPPIIAKLRRAERATAIAVVSVACVATLVFTAAGPLGGLVAVVWLATLFWSILGARIPKEPKVFKAKPLYEKRAA